MRESKSKKIWVKNIVGMQNVSPIQPRKGAKSQRDTTPLHNIRRNKLRYSGNKGENKCRKICRCVTEVEVFGFRRGLKAGITPKPLEDLHLDLVRAAGRKIKRFPNPVPTLHILPARGFGGSWQKGWR